MLRPAQACLSCRIPVFRQLALCEHCEADLPWQIPGCQRCGVSMDDNSVSTTATASPGPVPNDPGAWVKVCLNCQQLPPHFDRCMPLFAYQVPISGMIKRFKEHACFSDARCLGHLMSAAFRQHYLEQDLCAPAFLLPVPLHSRRVRQRGFNQAAMLCDAISKSSGIPVLRHACERRPGMHAQRGLGAQARHLNMQGIFYRGRQTHLTAGRHIAIIDDVVTTTATVNAMSAVLRQHGVAQIDIWSIARAN